MVFNTDSLSFQWTPKNKEVGYHLLQYKISYRKITGMKKEIVEGQIKIENQTEEIEETKNYTIFVNAPPQIKTEQKDYNIQANHELKVALQTNDKNSQQTLKVKSNFKNRETTTTTSWFTWIPKKQDYGNHEITFYVDDSMLID